MKGKEAGLFLAQQQANQNTDFFNNIRTKRAFAACAPMSGKFSRLKPAKEA